MSHRREADPKPGKGRERGSVVRDRVAISLDLVFLAWLVMHSLSLTSQSTEQRRRVCIGSDVGP